MSIDVTTLAVSKKYTDKQIEKVSIKGVDLSGYVQSVNGVKPDKNGNVEVSGGNPDFRTDETLTLKNGILSVNTTNDMEQDNTLPITSAGVFATVGNIEALLKTI